MTFEDELLALERRVLEKAGGDFFRSVAELRRMIAADEPGLPVMLARLAVPALEATARQGALDGWNLGGQRAITAAETARRVAPNVLNDADLRLLTPPAHLTDPFTGLDALLADAKARSVALLRSGADPVTAASPVFQAATTARSRIVTQINAASNAAAEEVGEATRSPMVWEAERDACVYCLALAGEIVQKAGDLFPAADLYAPTPPSMTTKTAPPLHPHCRCRLAVLVSREYADALKREAQRSILRGHSLASESHAVRIRAAERLLARNPVAPKTVKAFAAAAVKRGRFPTRDVPKGDPRLIIERAGPPKPPPPPEPPPASPRFDPSGFKRIKPESGLAAARRTNPLQPTDRAYQINCSHVVNAVELRQRGLDVVATSRPSLDGRLTEETAADWVAPDGKAPPIYPVSRYYGGRELEGLEENTSHLPKGARGFVRVAWEAGGAHIFNWEKTADEYVPGLKFHEGQVEAVTSTQARAYFKRIKPGSVAWFRVDDAEPAAHIAVTVEPSAAQAEEAARLKAAKKAEAERRAREEQAWRDAVEARRRARLPDWVREAEDRRRAGPPSV